ncbi:hypothetical protein LAV72_18415 [Lysinibacillus xylanilyticus]|uniref:hypothetical protein n=1 Tax=Lysinibacillus TaxID=400634 RepID=UPI002B24BAAB|nr:hypothetical protein [Lysinibacillus xylanilyticus]MEB2301581.1 hypothetical protein [Lysinibacillus xylanilyticus]
MITKTLPERIKLTPKQSAPIQHRCILIASSEAVPHKLIDIEFMDVELTSIDIQELVELNYMSIRYLHQSDMRIFIGMVEPEQTFFVYQEITF